MSGKQTEGRENLDFTGRRPIMDEAAEDKDTARVVEAVQAGDTESFSIIYRRYFHRVYGYFRLFFKDRDEAEDAAQQLFTQIFEALPRYELRKQPFRAWLFTSAKNLALYQLRALNRVEPVDPAELDRVVERDQPLDGEAALKALNWINDVDLLIFVQRLSLVQRQVLMLRFLMDMPSKQIAAIVHRTPSDVRMMQSRALRALHERLAAIGRAPILDLPERDPENSRTYLRQAPVLRARRFSLKDKRRR